MKNIVLIVLIVMLFVLFLSVICIPASGKIYSWIDEDGVQHFSDTPTCNVEQESNGTAPFLIDRKERKQIVQPQNLQPKNIIDFEVPKKTYPNQKVFVQHTIPKLKSGAGQTNKKNINFFEIFISSLSPIVFPLFLLVLFLKLLQMGQLL